MQVENCGRSPEGEQARPDPALAAARVGKSASSADPHAAETGNVANGSAFQPSFLASVAGATLEEPPPPETLPHLAGRPLKTCLPRQLAHCLLLTIRSFSLTRQDSFKSTDLSV